MKLNWALGHAILFYVVWFVAVTAAALPGGEWQAKLVQAGFVLVCLYFARENLRRELAFLLALTVLGGAIDTLPVYYGFVEFPATQYYLFYYPLWMFGMWSCFATAYSTSLAWLEKKTLLQALFGAIGGPLSLLAASKIGAVSFPRELGLTLFIIALEWAVVMVLSFQLFRRLHRPVAQQVSVK